MILLQLTRILNIVILLGSAVPVILLYTRFYSERNRNSKEVQKVNAAMRYMLMAFASYIAIGVFLNINYITGDIVTRYQISAINALQNTGFLIAMENLYKMIREVIDGE